MLISADDAARSNLADESVASPAPRERNTSRRVIFSCDIDVISTTSEMNCKKAQKTLKEEPLRSSGIEIQDSGFLEFWILSNDRGVP